MIKVLRWVVTTMSSGVQGRNIMFSGSSSFRRWRCRFSIYGWKLNYVNFLFSDMVYWYFVIFCEERSVWNTILVDCELKSISIVHGRNDLALHLPDIHLNCWYVRVKQSLVFDLFQIDLWHSMRHRYDVLVIVLLLSLVSLIYLIWLLCDLLLQFYIFLFTILTKFLNVIGIATFPKNSSGAIFSLLILLILWRIRYVFIIQWI